MTLLDGRCEYMRRKKGQEGQSKSLRCQRGDTRTARLARVFMLGELSAFIDLLVSSRRWAISEKGPKAAQYAKVQYSYSVCGRTEQTGVVAAAHQDTTGQLGTLGTKPPFRFSPARKAGRWIHRGGIEMPDCALARLCRACTSQPVPAQPSDIGFDSQAAGRRDRHGSGTTFCARAGEQEAETETIRAARDAGGDYRG